MTLTRLSADAVAVLRTALTDAPDDLAHPNDLLAALRSSDTPTGRLLRQRLPADERRQVERASPASASLALADVLRRASQLAPSDRPITTRDLLAALVPASDLPAELSACVAAIDAQGPGAPEQPRRRASQLTATSAARPANNTEAQRPGPVR